MSRRLRSAPKLREPQVDVIRVGDMVTIVGAAQRGVVVGLYSSREFHCQWIDSGRLSIEPRSHLRQVVEGGRVLTHRDL